MQIIHRLTVVSNPTRVFEVGTEIDGREVIEIKQVGEEYEDHIHSEYYVLDENSHLITSVENAPVIVDWKTIVEDGPAPENEK
ncbi:hypothetical protein SLT67_14170 [Paenibacillus illinoisensis]|uniref:hypothetical protein n=1 Tax=Paenibacillus illinoisensis TaxID=59845 RepID=UPI00203BF13D|nr:hypothetical protein [Paenibacillus illinoisensis]MCM3206422.1 hypothetical protein [Paenibacillus illinoisensis]